MGQVTLKNLPQLKRLTSRYTKKQPGTGNASDAVEVMGEGRVVLENLPALETVQLNGTSLLNAGEIVFQNLPKLQTVEMAGLSPCNYTAVSFNSWGVGGV